VVERGEEHDRHIGDCFGKVFAFYSNVDRAKKSKITEGEGKQLQKYSAGAENVHVVRTIEAAIAACAVARREDKAAAHVVHALATMSATTLDAR